MLERMFYRFLRVFLFSLVIIMPAVPQDFSKLEPYIIKLGMAMVIAAIAAGDKMIRDYVGK